MPFRRRSFDLRDNSALAISPPIFRLGLSDCGGELESASTSQLLALAENVEALGFDAVWIHEEHFQGSIIEVEERRCPSSPFLASAFGAAARIALRRLTW